MAVTTIGQAFVEIVPDAQGFGKDTEKELDRQLKGVGDKAGKTISDGLSSSFKKIGTVAAAAGVGAFFKGAIDSATDLNEQVSKAGVVFGQSADKVLAFGKNAAASIGSSEREAVAAAATFGNLLKSTGLAADRAADMSVNMVQLAGDLASFNNVPVGEALDAIRSGLVGETEPLKRFAVNLNEATLKAEAMRLGLSDGKGVLDANAKSQAAYSIIMRQTSDAQGDYARTADSLANRQRTLSALFEDAKAKIGQALLPTMQELMGVATDLLPALTSTGTAVANIAALAGKAVGPVAELLGAFAGSDMGQTAITAAALAVAYEKLGVASLFSAGGLTKMRDALAGLNPVMAIASVAAAAFIQEMGRQSEAAQANKARHEAMMDAFNEQAPITSVTDKFKGLVDQLTQVEGSSQDATDAVTDTASAMEIAAQLTEADRKNLERFGITQQDIADAINRGGPAYDALKDKIDKVTDAHKLSFIGGAKWLDQQQQAKSTLDELARSNAESAAQRVADAQATVDQAVKAGLLTQAWVDSQLAADEAKGTEQQWLDLMAEATPLLEGRQVALQASADAATEAAEKDKAWADATADARQRMVDADRKAMDAAADLAVQYGLGEDQAERLAAANDLTKDATQRHTDAEKELKDALDKVSESQQSYLFTVGGAQATVDDTTKATRDFIKTLVEGTDVLGRGTTALEGNSDAAINNRDALQTVRERALDVIEGFDKLGYTADQAAAGQQQLADDMYNTALAAGATEDEANAARDAILGIPIKHETDITAQAQVDQANRDLDHAARERDAVISVSLQAVGVSNELLAAVRGNQLTFNAEGGLFPHRPGGHLAVIGEGSEDEAVVPLGRNFADNLARIVGPANMAKLGGGGIVNNVAVTIANAPADRFEADRLGRIMGETAAQVLATRQVATNMKLS